MIQLTTRNLTKVTHEIWILFKFVDMFLIIIYDSWQQRPFQTTQHLITLSSSTGHSLNHNIIKRQVTYQNPGWNISSSFDSLIKYKYWVWHIPLTSLWFGLFPIDTVTPHGMLMLRNCFLDFAVEHWFGCHATEPGFAGDIGAIEVRLIDWLIMRKSSRNFSNFPMKHSTFCR